MVVLFVIFVVAPCIALVFLVTVVFFFGRDALLPFLLLLPLPFLLLLDMG